MFDSFIASLRCPNCGAMEENAEIQTHIRTISADGSALKIGFELDQSDVETENILGGAYLLVNPPDDIEPIRILDVWRCSHCKTEQWAVVEINERKIFSIEAVKLDRNTLESANFISDINAELLAKSLQEDQQVTSENCVDILRQKFT